MKSVAGVFVVFCLAYFHDVHAKVRILQKSHVDLDTRLIFGYNSYVDERLAYTLCDNNPSANEVKCTIVREKQPYGNDDYSCNVTIKRDDGDEKYKPMIRLYQFGDRYATLNSWEGGSEKYLRFTTVQLDSCKVVETKFNASIGDHYFDMTFVGHSDSFDVFYYDTECGNAACKVSVDSKGTFTREQSLVGKYMVGPHIAKETIVEFDNNTSGMGYFYFGLNGLEYAHVLIMPNGTEKSLARHPFHGVSTMLASTKNNLVGVCYQTTTEYKCSQYDADGKMKLQTTIARDYKDKMQLADIYNSPNGGLYVFSRVCEKLDHGEEGCQGGVARFVIERIKACGSKSQPITFQIPSDYLSYDYGYTSVIYENESKETCVSVVVFDHGHKDDAKNRKAQLHSTANCFTDADFIQ